MLCARACLCMHELCFTAIALCVHLLQLRTELVRKVSSVRGTRYFELALRLLLWRGFRVPRDRCWNAETVTGGPTRSPHCESKPKLCFIRLLSLQRLSHHSINIPVCPLQICFPSFFWHMKMLRDCSRLQMWLFILYVGTRNHTIVAPFEY